MSSELLLAAVEIMVRLWEETARTVNTCPKPRGPEFDSQKPPLKREKRPSIGVCVSYCRRDRSMVVCASYW